MKLFRFIVLFLVIVGAINWGLWGAFDYDIIARIAGGNTTFFAKVLYVIVGLAGIYGLSFFFVPGIYSSRCACKEK